MGVFFNFKLFTESKLNRSLLFKYFKAYIILLLILCLSTCIIYGIMNRSLKEQIVRVNNVLIQNIANFLEKEFTNLDELITLINSNSKIIKYMNMQYEHFSPYVNYSAYEVLKDIAAYVNSNNFIDNIYIFFNNESVISNTYKADNGYYYKNLDKNQFNNIDLINSYNFKNIFYVHDNKENAKIYYANTLPLGSRNVHKATIIIQIDSEFIKSRIRDNQFTEKTEIIILNSERASIMKYSLSNISFRDKELVMTSVKSDMLKWEIVSQIPKTQFEAKLIYIRSAIIFILLFALLIGIACAIYFSYKNYKPIVKLIETLGNGSINNMKDDLFIALEDSISKTINENRNLKKKIDTQTDLIKNNVIEKLVKQEVSDLNKIDKAASISNIKFESSCFIVCSIKLDISGNSSINYLVIMEQLKTLADNEQKGYVFYINESNISILIEVIDKSKFNPLEFGKRSIQILNMHNINSTIGIGGYCDSIKKLNRSYKEALLALNILHNSKGEVLFYDSVKNLISTKTRYNYTIFMEQQIIINAKTGNIEKVKKLLEEVYNENFKEIQLSGQISQILIYNVISTVIRILDELKIDLSKFEDTNILQQLYNAETVSDAFGSLISAYTVICDLVNQGKRSSNRCLFEKIENYLKSEYNNRDISVEYIAEKFNISASYLSRFFKEQAGTNFYDYLQKLRIGKAKEIFVQNDNIQVQEVALKVGYSNPRGLIRAFNKYEGITPGEYKNKYS